MTSLIDSFKNAAKKLTTATTTITDEIARLRTQIIETRRGLDRATSLPLPVDEIIQTRITAHVQQLGAYWLAQQGTLLIQALGMPNASDNVLTPWMNIREPIPWALMCAAEPDRAVAILAALVGRVPYDAGLPIGARPAAVAALERELSELETIEESMIDAAALSGVAITHRPEVLERRELEARRLQRQEQSIEYRRRQEAALNTKRAARPVTGRSEYLTKLAGGAAASRRRLDDHGPLFGR